MNNLSLSVQQPYEDLTLRHPYIHVFLLPLSFIILTLITPFKSLLHSVFVSASFQCCTHTPLHQAKEIESPSHLTLLFLLIKIYSQDEQLLI